MNGKATLVDARGLRCPWPVLRLSRAVRELGGRGQLRILADDPVAPAELRALCSERGWAFTPDSSDDQAFEVQIS